MSLFNKILSQIDINNKEKEQQQQQIIDIVQMSVGVQIKKELFTIKNKVLFLQTTPTIKSAILLKKETILKALQEKGFTIIDIH